MANNGGLYNMGGGQVTPVPQQRQASPWGGFAQQRPASTGSQGQDTESGQGGPGMFNLMDILKKLIGLPLQLFGMAGGEAGGDAGKGPDYSCSGSINPENSGYSMGGQWYPTSPESVRAHRTRKQQMQNAWTQPLE